MCVYTSQPDSNSIAVTVDTDLTTGAKLVAADRAMWTARVPGHATAVPGLGDAAYLGPGPDGLANHHLVVFVGPIELTITTDQNSSPSPAQAEALARTLLGE
jgi:hypothetical protein